MRINQHAPNRWALVHDCPDLVFNTIPTRFSDTTYIYACLRNGIINRTPGFEKRIIGDDYA